jgi:hypothetical protein
MNIDFTTTAMARPEILEQTYQSFSENLRGLDLNKCRLFINIDPLPEGVNRNGCIVVAKKYFKEVVVNLPEEPNYTAAYNWLWSSAESEFIFNLEDDWRLAVEVRWSDLIAYFKKYPQLLSVALRAYRYDYKSCPTSPSVMHRRFYGAVGGNLDETINPESQLRGANFGIEMPAKVFGIPPKGKVVAHPHSGVILEDLGRDWIKQSDYRIPPVKKNRFVRWVKK